MTVETLCEDCDGSDTPVFGGQIVFQGDYVPITCDLCGEELMR